MANSYTDDLVLLRRLAKMLLEKKLKTGKLKNFKDINIDKMNIAQLRKLVDDLLQNRLTAT